MFAPRAAPRTGTSAANEAQGRLAAGFRVGVFFFFSLFHLMRMLQKQKHFCKKQGKDSVGTWLGDGLNSCILQAGGPSPALTARISRSSFSAEVGEMNPTGV